VDNLKSIAVELEVWVCLAGYEMTAIDLPAGGIASLRTTSPEALPMVVPKDPEKMETRTITRISPIWRELVRLDNVRQVARQSKVHRMIVQFCEKYGMPCKGLIALRTPVKEALVVEIVDEARRIVVAIKNAEDGAVEVPEDVMDAFQDGITFRFDGTAGEMFLTFTNTLLAAWFSLINSRVCPERVCEFCQGVNVARAGSDFCTDYCRDKHHKMKMRKREK